MILVVDIDDCPDCVINWKDHVERCRAQSAGQSAHFGAQSAPSLEISVQSTRNNGIEQSDRYDSSSEDSSGDNAVNTSSRTRPAGDPRCKKMPAIALPLSITLLSCIRVLKNMW